MTHADRHIVGMGGGGFSEEMDNPLLDDFVLGLTGKDRPRVCFIPTASGDAQGYVEKFYNLFPPERATVSHLGLFRASDATDSRKLLLNQDVIYVGGGSTINMLAIWRIHGIDRILCDAWKAGVVLTGLSAGMICWFEEGLTMSLAGTPSPLKNGLGIIRGSACPHYDSEDERPSAYHEFVAGGDLASGVAADDGTALHYVGLDLAEVVASRPEARAYTVKRVGDKAVEVPLETRYLGA